MPELPKSTETVMASINLSELIDAMQSQSDDVSFFIHRKTGEFQVYLNSAVDADQAEIEAELDENPDDWLEIPDRYEINEYRMMEFFAMDLENDDQRTRLLNSLRGNGAFRRFKAMAGDLGLLQPWFSYRDRGYEEIARVWCDDHDLGITNDSVYM